MVPLCSWRLNPCHSKESAGLAHNRHEQAANQNARATPQGHFEMPGCQKLAGARAVALAMATIEAVARSSFPFEQNQTKAFSF
jgi:hypothetical protein